MEKFYVADWYVDVAASTLKREKVEVKLEPKVMAVLVCLAENAGSVLSRETLESTVWAGRVVGYDALGNTIIKLRRAFADDARHPRFIETISKKGYRLIAEVSNLPDENQLQAGSATFNIINNIQAKDLSPASVLVDGGLPPPPEMPSIAVLAFDNMSSDPEQGYFSDGLSEDLITDLSKFPGLLVIARNSSFSYKGSATQVKQMSAELGVRFVLEGSVRRSGEKLRITAQLIDAMTGGHVWAERFDRQQTEVFAIQDEVRQLILTQLMPKLLTAEQNYHINRHLDDVTAYDHFLHGREYALQDTAPALQNSAILLRKALSSSPGFSSAWSHLGRILTLNYINRWGEGDDRSIERGLEYNFKAVGLDEWNAHAHFSVAATALWMKQHDMALESARRAIEIDPNFSDAHAALGAILMYSGDPEAGVKSVLKSLRVDPKFRDIYLHLLAQAYFHMEDYDNAIAVLKKRLIRKPESDISHALLAACYGHLGEKQLGKREWQDVLRSNPDYSVQHRCAILPYKHQQAVKQFSSGLEKLGIVA